MIHRWLAEAKKLGARHICLSDKRRRRLITDCILSDKAIRGDCLDPGGFSITTVYPIRFFFAFVFADRHSNRRVVSRSSIFAPSKPLGLPHAPYSPSGECTRAFGPDDQNQARRKMATKSNRIMRWPPTSTRQRQRQRPRPSQFGGSNTSTKTKSAPCGTAVLGVSFNQGACFN